MKIYLVYTYQVATTNSFAVIIIIILLILCVYLQNKISARVVKIATIKKLGLLSRFFLSLFYYWIQH